MKVQELRIRNIVEYLIRDEMDAKKEWWEPSQIDAQDILWLSQNPDDEDYRPMTITEELLVRFGFEKELGSYAYRMRSFAIIFWPSGLITFEYKNIEICELKYVHQLQNLIFAISGEELTTTPIQ